MINLHGHYRYFGTYLLLVIALISTLLFAGCDALSGDDEADDADTLYIYSWGD